MASTVKLQDLVNSIRVYPELVPVMGSSGWTQEPAVTIANITKQFILAPPFAWRWNRNTVTFSTVIGTQDYSQAVADFGWLEKATINDGAGNVRELEVTLNLSEDTLQNQPVRVAARLDDDAGNITFRLLPVPDKIYTVTITYQKAATLFTTLSGLWSPIPDYLYFMYHQGFLARCLEWAGDPRAETAIQLFMQQLISTNAGLSESQVNLFLSPRVNSERTVTAERGKASIPARVRETRNG